MNAIIVIPIYKKQPDANEILSLRQCCKILHRYDICLVCPENLNTTPYEKIADKKFIIERFIPSFFKGIDGYNRLMTNMYFYKRFENYDYMLIYQLDAWVFSDKLEEWCQKGYDYVGAPWFENYLAYEDGCALWNCGNGGLSLRKIAKFIEITNPKARVMTTSQILKKYFRNIKTWDRGLGMLLYKNRIKSYSKKAIQIWEDAYFCNALDDTLHKLNNPTAKEAAEFAFDRSPKYLYKLLNNSLPFGCHAWEKYQYKEFWSDFIPEFKKDIII